MKSQNKILENLRYACSETHLATEISPSHKAANDALIILLSSAWAHLYERGNKVRAQPSFSLSLHVGVSPGWAACERRGGEKFTWQGELHLSSHLRFNRLLFYLFHSWLITFILHSDTFQRSDAFNLIHFSVSVWRSLRSGFALIHYSLFSEWRWKHWTL